jgi:N-acylneuraminate cytidylyltransferase
VTTPTRIVALVPARGGSRRIPGKNLVNLGDKPLIAHTIEAAQRVPLIEETYVSTDDRAIARTARGYGARVLRRPRRLAGDRASTESVLLHVLDRLTFDRARPTIIVLLQATSPLRSADSIEKAVDKLLDTGCDSVISVHEERGWFWDGELRGDIFVPQREIGHRPRTQEIPSRFRENGAIYVMRTELLARTGLRMGGDVRAIVLPSHEAVDIDTHEDLALAGYLLQERERQARSSQNRPSAGLTA